MHNICVALCSNDIISYWQLKNNSHTILSTSFVILAPQLYNFRYMYTITKLRLNLITHIQKQLSGAIHSKRAKYYNHPLYHHTHQLYIHAREQKKKQQRGQRLERISERSTHSLVLCARIKIFRRDVYESFCGADAAAAACLEKKICKGECGYD